MNSTSTIRLMRETGLLEKIRIVLDRFLPPTWHPYRLDLEGDFEMDAIFIIGRWKIDARWRTVRVPITAEAMMEDPAIALADAALQFCTQALQLSGAAQSAAQIGLPALLAEPLKELSDATR